MNTIRGVFCPVETATHRRDSTSVEGMITSEKFNIGSANGNHCLLKLYKTTLVIVAVQMEKHSDEPD